MKTMMNLLLLLTGILLSVTIAQPATGAPERRWTMEGIFRNQTKPMYIYASVRDGRWITAVGSSRDPARDGRKTYNKSW